MEQGARTRVKRRVPGPPPQANAPPAATAAGPANVSIAPAAREEKRAQKERAGLPKPGEEASSSKRPREGGAKEEAHVEKPEQAKRQLKHWRDVPSDQPSWGQ